MTDVGTWKLDTTELDRIVAGLDKSVEDVIEGIASEIERDARQFAPVRTGALRNSIYTATKHANAVPSVTAPTEALPSPSGDIIAIIGPSVNYGAYVEL